MQEKDYEQLFQDRVDELCLLEQRIDRRAETFLELVGENQTKLEKLQDKISSIDGSLKKINVASDRIEKYATLCEKEASNATKLFVMSVSFAVVVVFCSLLWSYHVKNNLADAKAELASLNFKLKHTPVFMKVEGADYVRIVRDTETTLTHNRYELSGEYAKVWHAR